MLSFKGAGERFWVGFFLFFLLNLLTFPFLSSEVWSDIANQFYNAEKEYWIYTTLLYVLANGVVPL